MDKMTLIVYILKLINLLIKLINGNLKIFGCQGLIQEFIWMLDGL